MVQEHRPGQLEAFVVAHGELDLGEEVTGPALGHQERTALPGQGRPEGAGVGQAHPLGQGVDTQRHPGQVQEGEGRQSGHRDPAVGPQQLDGALGHQRRAGHGVDHRSRAPPRRRPSTSASTMAS